jgi:hypothetical protein
MEIGTEQFWVLAATQFLDKPQPVNRERRRPGPHRDAAMLNPNKSLSNKSGQAHPGVNWTNSG